MGGVGVGGMAFGPGRGLLSWAFCPPPSTVKKHPGPSIQGTQDIQEGPGERLNSRPHWRTCRQRILLSYL